MSWFSKIFTSSFNVENGGTYWFPSSEGGDPFKRGDYAKQFSEIPEINAILNIRARAMSSWRLSIQSKGTGKEQSNNESLVRILRLPNWFQSQSEMWKQSNLFRDIWGNEYLYFLRPFGMSSTFKGLFTLDPSKVTIEYKSEDVYFHESKSDYVRYFYDLGNGKKIELEKDNLIHLNDNRVTGDTFLRGTSKMKALQAPINNIREAYKKRNIILKMPVGILSNGQSDAIGQAVPMNPKEKQDVQTKLQTRGAFPIITNLAVKYADMNVNAANMGLFNEVREDTGRLCDAYGVPYELLASEKGITYANLKEAKKQFYEETIIPDADEKIQAINMFLETENKSWHVVADFSYLPVFSENVKERSASLTMMVNALSKALTDGAITIDQYKVELQKFRI
jgi:HK97 family phage portal protein